MKRQGKEIFYYANKNECDFIIKNENKITNAIQVCHIIHEENKERETKGLLEALNTFQLKKGHLLTSEQEEEITLQNKKIIIMPIWKWLIKNNPT